MSQKITKKGSSFRLNEPQRGNQEVAIGEEDLSQRDPNNHLRPKETLHQLFEYQAKKYSTKPAIEHDFATISYSSLNHKANQLSCYLSERQVKKGDLVVILMDRCPSMLVAIMGILKSGAAYLPIDPSYPAERIRYILNDSKAKIILTKSNFLNELSFYGDLEYSAIKHLVVDMDTIELNYDENELSNSESTGSLDDLAYVIYTSGSTGKPKGVMVTHRNVTNYVDWFTKKFGVNDASRFDFSSSLSFDFSVSCTLVPLLAGCCISITSDETKKDPMKYIQSLKLNKITHIKSTPGYFNKLLNFNEEIAKLMNLEWIILGGEPINKKDVLRWLLINPLHTIVTEYGPTESTVATTAYIIRANSLEDDHAAIPIGEPAFNTQVHILNKKGRICKTGELGEIYIAGESVSKGYLKLPDLTEKKFLPDIFSEDPESKMYRTGDLGLVLPNGLIEHKGRIDNQVKIRGYRVKLEEVEQALLRHENVQQACVIMKKIKGEAHLIGFVVSSTIITPENLKDHLNELLPSYMVPSFFALLDTLPLSTHEIIDRKKLSQLKIVSPSSAESLKPSNDTEEELLKIYSKFLPVAIENICMQTGFFALGGNSLIAIKIINAINKKYIINLNIASIIKAPTIRLMNELISNTISKKYLKGYQESISDHLFSISLIPLKTSGAKTPIFFLHPLGGTVFGYRQLVEHISPQQPCYAIQDPSIALQKPCFSSLEKMVSCYLTMIKRIQPHGPYILSGHSYGGTLAFEMARQLIKQKEQVEKIILLDSWAFFTENPKGKENLKTSISIQLRKNKEQLNLEGVDYPDAWENLNEHRAELGCKYKPVKLDVNLILVKAAELLPEYTLIEEAANYWGNYSLNPVLVISAPGDHETMLSGQNSRYLARTLEEILLNSEDHIMVA